MAYFEFEYYWVSFVAQSGNPDVTVCIFSISISSFVFNSRKKLKLVLNEWVNDDSSIKFGWTGPLRSGWWDAVNSAFRSVCIFKDIVAGLFVWNYNIDFWLNMQTSSTGAGFTKHSSGIIIYSKLKWQFTQKLQFCQHFEIGNHWLS